MKKIIIIGLWMISRVGEAAAPSLPVLRMDHPASFTLWFERGPATLGLTDGPCTVWAAMDADRWFAMIRVTGVTWSASATEGKPDAAVIKRDHVTLHLAGMDGAPSKVHFDADGRWWTASSLIGQDSPVMGGDPQSVVVALSLRAYPALAKPGASMAVEWVKAGASPRPLTWHPFVWKALKEAFPGEHIVDDLFFVDGRPFTGSKSVGLIEGRQTERDYREGRLTAEKAVDSQGNVREDTFTPDGGRESALRDARGIMKESAFYGPGESVPRVVTQFDAAGDTFVTNRRTKTEKGVIVSTYNPALGVDYESENLADGREVRVTKFFPGKGKSWEQLKAPDGRISRETYWDAEGRVIKESSDGRRWKDGSGAWLHGVIPSADGQRMENTYQDGWLERSQIVDVEGRPVQSREFRQGEEIKSMAWFPDGRPRWERVTSEEGEMIDRSWFQSGQQEREMRFRVEPEGRRIQKSYTLWHANGRVAEEMIFGEQRSRRAWDEQGRLMLDTRGDHVARMGWGLEPLSGEEARMAGVISGVKISTLVPGSPAAQAGFQTKDILLSIEQTPAMDVEKVRAALNAFGDRARVKCEVRRSGQRLTVMVQL